MSSQDREISTSKKYANLCTLDAAVTLVSMLLWLQLSSVVMLDCHLILIKIKIISWTFEKKKKKIPTISVRAKKFKAGQLDISSALTQQCLESFLLVYFDVGVG